MEKNVDKVTQNQVLEKKPTGLLKARLVRVMDEYFDTLKRIQKDALVTGPILEEVEAAVYESAMRFTHGNQSLAARLLGVSRGTLRTKLVHYFGTTHVGETLRAEEAGKASGPLNF